MFWDKGVLQLVEAEMERLLVSCRISNCEDGFSWLFVEVYGLVRKREGIFLGRAWSC